MPRKGCHPNDSRQIAVRLHASFFRITFCSLLAGRCRLAVARAVVFLSVCFSSLLSLASLLFATPCCAAPQDFQVKAAYIINFTRYTNWPVQTSHLLCIVGADDVADWLEKNQDKSGLTVKRLTQTRDVVGCSLLFLGQDSSQTSAWLSAVHDKAVLTVSERGGFLQKGGMINLLVQGNALKFEVNLDNAREAQLKFSSRMLAIAEKIEGGGQ